jgi:hypothetical protein
MFSTTKSEYPIFKPWIEIMAEYANIQTYLYFKKADRMAKSGKKCVIVKNNQCTDCGLCSED